MSYTTFQTSLTPPSFENLRLKDPIGIQGGAILSKIDCSGRTFLQTPEASISKFDFSKNESTQPLTLSFDLNNNETNSLMEWIEKFENKIKTEIYDSRDKWFDGDIDHEDVDFFFQSSIKRTKNNAILRIFLSRLSKPLRAKLENPRECEEYGVNIFNEEEDHLDFSDINSNETFISLIEPIGVKFTSTSFHIVYYLRQLMMLSPEVRKPLINKCLIETKSRKNNNLNQSQTNEKPEHNVSHTEIENVNIDLNTPSDNSETIQLKQPNQIYIDMYKDMRKRAKKAKHEAEQAFLEAKQIKQSYQLNIDSDTDTEYGSTTDEE
jgi:hypothetical protein